MKKIIPIYLILFVLLIQVNSCNTDPEALMPVISGNAGELMIVAPEEYLESEVGDSITSIFSQQEIALPQYGMQGGEPIFDLLTIPKLHFKDILRAHRNIIIISISPENTEPKIIIKNNYWSKGQLLIYINTPDQESFIKLLDDKKDFLINKILDAERNRQITINKKYENIAASQQLARNHAYVLNMPKGFNIDVDDENFVWISHKPKDMLQNIIVYYIDYQGPEVFNKENILHLRDSVMKLRVPGGKEGSYLTTERNFPIWTREFNIDDRYTFEVRGLWRVEGDYMGGPFICYCTVDEARNRLMFVEGFVYRPNKAKRNALRKVESIMRTLRFVE